MNVTLNLAGEEYPMSYDEKTDTLTCHGSPIDSLEIGCGRVLDKPQLITIMRDKLQQQAAPNN